MLFSFFSLAFLPGDVLGSACSNSLYPPFIATGVKPNILIILDNSNSMDEDFFGNAVGSYSPASKTVVAKQALQNVVTNLQSKANVGIMTYSLPNDIVAMQIHNAMPFASYNPNSYCSMPPTLTAAGVQACLQACVTFCMNPNDTVSSAACDACCPPNASLGQTFTSFTTQTFTHNDGTQTNFPDLILSTTLYGATTDPNSTRARYCGLVYPKTQMWQYQDKTDPLVPSGFTTTVYYNQTDPFYDWGDDGILFGYSGSDSSNGSPYNPGENAGNTYVYCPNKQGTSDSFAVYTDSSGASTNGCHTYQFAPTDSDWALGFYNWGQEMPWYWVGPTWFSWSQASGNPTSPTCCACSSTVTSGCTCQGYLHVPVGPVNFCSNSSGVSNGQACSTTSDCTDPYNSSCSNICFNSSGVSNGQACSSISNCTAPYNSSCSNNVMNILNPNANNSAGYMSCSAGNTPDGTMNTCPYIVNASNTPTAGTLNTAFNYFNGQLPGYSSPITSTCQKNYIIYATDGLPSTFMNGSQPTPNPSVMSNLMQEVITELTTLQQGVTPISGGSTYYINTYVLGMGLTTEAKANLDQMAVAGGTVTSSGHAYYADNPDQFVEALNSIITDLLARVAAGSSVSVLSEGQTQNGANMLQGVFYPSKLFGTASISWPGYLYDYWFYNGAAYTNIREDTVHDYILELNEDYAISFVFDLNSGLSVNRYKDSNDALNLGDPDTKVDNVGLDSLTPLWEAGKLLFQTTPASRQIYTPGSSATGLVGFNTANAALTTPGSSPLGTPSNFDPCLQGSSDTATLQNLINYVIGTDLPNCRNRTVGLCSNGSPCSSASDCSSGVCTQNVWKLGDIVYSTPQVQADYKYCSNGASFNTQLCTQDSDCGTTGSFTSCQKKQSVIFVGANDGMLHAFQTGTLSTAGLNSAQYQVTELTGIPTPSMGQELWAFIPQNSLPYLRCLAVPPPGCHLYYNDLSPYITTMVSNGVSKTVLIGGMRLGGGAINSTTPGNYCFNSSGVSNGQPCSQNSDCTTAPYKSSCSSAYLINAPSDTCTPVTCADSTPCYTNCYNPSSCTGLSSYYALDITDAQNPKLLWEFSHPFLGYSYSGPAVIHKWSNTGNPCANPPISPSGDQYYVMFLSGPTNPVDGSSIQDLQAFVLSLNANLTIKSVYRQDFGATTANGSGGRLFTNGLDVNGDGYTDFVFFGYGNSPTGSSTGWQGGIGKIYTSNSDPTTWGYDVTTYANIATLPITARIATEQCFNTWYLYAGTGRYFSSLLQYDYTGSGPNYLMGIPFTCDQCNNNCTSIASLNSPSSITTACTNASNTTNPSNPSSILPAGWQYPLEPASGSYLGERLVTDPTVSTGTNTIFFTTSEPNSEPCGYGGQSRIWGLNCATGEAIAQSCGTYTVTSPTGTLYLQTSTGAIYQINVATNTATNTASSFVGTGPGDGAAAGNRTTIWYHGMPPETSVPEVQPATSAAKSGQLIQWIER
jgi:type IV pilus assembly protein PilY1